jgi:hypothetical protein
MTAAVKAIRIVNTLMQAGSRLSELLADTTILDVPGRDLRLIDQLIGMSVQSIKIGLRCGASEEKLSEGAEQFAAIARNHLDDLQRWLSNHPSYVSQTSDGRLRSGKPVDGDVIRDTAAEVHQLLTTLSPPAGLRVAG